MFNAVVTEIKNKLGDVGDFIKKVDFDTKLDNISNKKTLNKTKEIKGEMKLNDQIASCTKSITRNFTNSINRRKKFSTGCILLYEGDIQN